MRYILVILTGLFVLLSAGGAHSGATTGQELGSEVFVGTTPGGALVREFVGGLASNAACDSITWQLTLATNQGTGLPATCSLAALYHVPKPSSPNHSEDGPKVELRGTWELLKGARSSPEEIVYRVTAEKRSLSFVKIGDGLLHLLNSDESLALGNGGQSYTLNRADRAEKPGDRELAMSAPSISYKISTLSTGATVFGVFEGRTPCHGISRELKIPQQAGCIKAKWRVTLYQNPETSAPTTYKVEGSLFRESIREGTWSISRGASIDSKAAVYQLNATATQPALLLMKGDDNVLFFLNQNREPLIGHSEFSYTLNRAVAK